MPISSSDLVYYGSTSAGSAGNTTAQTTPGSNLGKYVSTTVLTSGVLDNLFPDITGDENAADNVDYQCLFLVNNNGTLTLQNTYMWLYSEVTGGATTAIAVDNIGPVAVGSSSAQAAVIANKNTVPTGVGAFSAPTTKAAGILLGNIGPGQAIGIWVRRTATNSTVLNNDGFTLRCEGDTSA